MRILQVVEALQAVKLRIDIQHPQVGDRSGPDPDVGRWPSVPPGLDPARVTRGAKESIQDTGMLARVPAFMGAATTASGRGYVMKWEYRKS
jgi:hypothetical protein